MSRSQAIMIPFVLAILYSAAAYLGFFDVTKINELPMKTVGKLKDINTESDTFVSGKKIRIMLEDGTVYLANGYFDVYKPGDEVSVPAGSKYKYICLRNNCISRN